VIFNAVKHKVGAYFESARDDPAAELGALLLLVAGLPGEDALQDYATVAELLAGTADEASFVNYTRKTLPPATVTVDNATNRVVMSAAGNPLIIQWNNAGQGGAAQVVGAVVFYYAPTSGTADAGLVPLSSSAMRFTTDGSHLVITLGANGIAVARNPT
jgi:hypothetical protein